MKYNVICKTMFKRYVVLRVGLVLIKTRLLVCQIILFWADRHLRFIYTKRKRGPLYITPLIRLFGLIFDFPWHILNTPGRKLRFNTPPPQDSTFHLILGHPLHLYSFCSVVPKQWNFRSLNWNPLSTRFIIHYHHKTAKPNMANIIGKVYLDSTR